MTQFTIDPRANQLSRIKQRLAEKTTTPQPPAEYAPPPSSAPPAAPEQPVAMETMVYTGARYALYGGIGYLVADTWLGGRGLLGAGVGLVGGYLLERTVEQFLLTEGS